MADTDNDILLDNQVFSLLGFFETQCFINIFVQVPRGGGLADDSHLLDSSLDSNGTTLEVREYETNLCSLEFLFVVTNLIRGRFLFLFVEFSLFQEGDSSNEKQKPAPCVSPDISHIAQVIMFICSFLFPMSKLVSAPSPPKEKNISPKEHLSKRTSLQRKRTSLQKNISPKEHLSKRTSLQKNIPSKEHPFKRTSLQSVQVPFFSNLFVFLTGVMAYDFNFCSFQGHPTPVLLENLSEQGYAEFAAYTRLQAQEWPQKLEVLLTLSQAYWQRMNDNGALQAENQQLKSRQATFDSEVKAFHKSQEKLQSRFDRKKADLQALGEEHVLVRTQAARDKRKLVEVEGQLTSSKEEVAGLIHLAELDQLDFEEKLAGKRREINQLKTRVATVSFLAELDQIEVEAEVVGVVYLAELEAAEMLEELAIKDRLVAKRKREMEHRIGWINHLADLDHEDTRNQFAAIEHLAELEKADLVNVLYLQSEDLAAIIHLAGLETADLEIANIRSEGLLKQLIVVKTLNRTLERELSTSNQIKDSLHRKELVRKDRELLAVADVAETRRKRRREGNDVQDQDVLRPGRRDRVDEQGHAGDHQVRRDAAEVRARDARRLARRVEFQANGGYYH